MARLRVEIYSAYESRTTDSQTNLTNGAVQILIAGINIVRMPGASKITYEDTPRSRTMSSLAWEGVPSGCATMGEEAYRREISDIDGPYSASLGRLRKLVCAAYRKLEAEKEEKGIPTFTVTNQEVTDENRCEGCRFDEDVMAECFIFCGFSCLNCPWKDAKPEAMKMITETAAMTDEEMKMEGIEPDLVYNEKRKGLSLEDFFTRVDRIGIAHSSVAFHTDRPREFAHPTDKEGREASWNENYGEALIEEVDKSTSTFVLTPRNEVLPAGAKGVLFADSLGKKAERRGTLAEEGSSAELLIESGLIVSVVVASSLLSRRCCRGLVEVVSFVTLSRFFLLRLYLQQ